VKSYRRGHESSYKRELEAFRGLANQPGIIRCLGSYEMEAEGGYCFHIILEVSQMDLDTYFHKYNPPELSSEIVKFWKTIFPIAETIATIHTLEYQGPYEGEVYSG